VGVVETAAGVVAIVLVVLEGAQAAAEDERQIVGWAQARGQVNAVLALRALVFAVFRKVLFGNMAVPVKNAARSLRKSRLVS
jgi:hypothetical protein